jgi:hypothetical protein
MARFFKPLISRLLSSGIAMAAFLCVSQLNGAEGESNSGSLLQTEGKKLQAKVQTKLESSTNGTTGTQEPSSSDVAPQKGEKSKGLKGSEQEHLLRTIRTLPPEKRKQLLENLKAWQTLSDDQKQALRDRDGQLRKRATEEASALIADSNLSPEQAEQFQKRYIEERRKVDTSLKQELELRRKTELEEIAQRLRKEIQSPESDKKP